MQVFLKEIGTDSIPSDNKHLNASGISVLEERRNGVANCETRNELVYTFFENVFFAGSSLSHADYSNEK